MNTNKYKVFLFNSNSETHFDLINCNLDRLNLTNLYLLKKEDEKDLKHDIALAPVWIQKIMRKALIEWQQWILMR